MSLIDAKEPENFCHLWFKKVSLGLFSLSSVEEGHYDLINVSYNFGCYIENKNYSTLESLFMLLKLFLVPTFAFQNPPMLNSNATSLNLPRFLMAFAHSHVIYFYILCIILLFLAINLPWGRNFHIPCPFVSLSLVYFLYKCSINTFVEWN